MKTNKILALILALAMIMSTMGIVAFAAEKTVTTAQEFYDAIANAEVGDIINLDADVTYENGWEQIWDKDGLTINGNNHTLTLAKPNASTNNGGALMYHFTNLKVSNLTIVFPEGDITSVGFYANTGCEFDNVNIYNGKIAIDVQNNVVVKNSTFKNQEDVSLFPENDTSDTKIIGCTFIDTRAYIAYYNEEIKDNKIILENKTALSHYALTLAPGSTAVATGNNIGEGVGVELFDGAYTLEKNSILGDIGNFATDLSSAKIENNELSDAAVTTLRDAGLDVISTAPVAEINGKKYFSVQDAVDAAVIGTNEIQLLPGVIAEDVFILQKEGIDLVIKGQDGVVYTGSFEICGNNRGWNMNGGNGATETITFDGINFSGEDKTAAHDFIGSTRKNTVPPNGTLVWAYPHNVTVQNCTFKGNYVNQSDEEYAGKEVVALRNVGGYRWTVKNCVGTNLHSFMQSSANTHSSSIDYLEVTNSKTGLNLGTNANYTITNSIFDVVEYAIRTDANSDRNVELTITDCDISGENALIVRKADSANFTYDVAVNNNKIVTTGAGIKRDGGKDTDTITFDYSFNYWNGGEANVEGISESSVVASLPYYTDESMAEIGGSEAKVGDKYFETIQDAIDGATADDVVEILYSEEAYPQFRVPKNKPLTLRGVQKAPDARSLSGVNPVISITNLNNSWADTTGATYESKVTVENLDFVVEENAVGSGFMGVFSYLPDGQNVDGSSFTNCNFVNKSDLDDVKAIIAHAEDITVTNCTFENFKTAVYCCNDGGTLDEYSITNSTFDKVDYIIDGYWGYGEADSAVTFTGNTVNNAKTNGEVPTFIIWDYAYTTNNGAVPSVKNINIANNTYKTKAELVTIDMTSNTTVATDATWVKTYGTVDKAKNAGNLAENEVFYISRGYSLKDEAYKLNADSDAIKLEGGEITVVFESIKDENDKDTGAWNIVLQAAENTELFEFVTAELKFINDSLVESGFENKKMNYTVEGAENISVTKNLDENHEATYAFYLNALDANGDLVERPTGNKVTIGKIVFDGKGDMKLSVSDTSWVIGTVYGTNDEAVFVANDADAKYILKVDYKSDTEPDSFIDSTDVMTTKRDVKIKIDFEHDISMDKDADYRAIKVTLKDSIGNAPITKDVEIKDVNSGEVVFPDVTIGVITVTLKADGFRTYTYQTTMEDTEEEFVLNFWNSVKRQGDWYIEAGENRSKMMHNFLVGDIAMDYIIDKYDLAAVTSYYGNYDIKTGDKYVRYDLNRDGQIDILDVAYVLHGMGN